MLHGVIIVPVADLRSHAKPDAERLSQAIFGTPIIIEDTRRNFSLVKLPEGYKGWCRSPHIDQVAFARWQSYVKKPKHRIKVETAKVYHDQTPEAEPYRLYFGTEVALLKHGGKTRFTLPNGYRGQLSPSVLAEPLGKKLKAVASTDIIKTAKKFLGVPYLWGGITPAGYDCSGLVQKVYGFHGIKLPRDSSRQRKEGIKISRDSIERGDLLFFPGHVAIAINSKDFIHASASRGMVVIESLNPDVAKYRKDLDSKFEFARRLPL